MILYLSYFTVFKASKIIDNPANRRDVLKVAEIKRGSISDRNGEVLAYSDGEKYKYQRHYPYPTIYSHLVGYSSKVRGNSGIESSYNKYLLGREGSNTLKAIRAFFDKRIEVNAGNNLILTTDTNIQQRSRDLLDELGEKGAIVVMKPKTGEILSLVSYPDFNVESIDKDYAAIVERNEGAFFNNAIQGLYTPGSTMKIVTAASIIESGINQDYTDIGEEKLGGYPIKNSKNMVYGDINLMEAFTFSVNTYFANKAIGVGKDKFGETAEKFMFNKKIQFDLNTTTTELAISKCKYKDWDNQALASAGIGQADIGATPLEMCMVASAVANEGKMMKPYLVSKVTNNAGNTILENKPEVLSEAMKVETANQIREMMINVVNKGSGKSAALRNVQVAGKTGTAQRSVEKSINNAWFIGFAPAEDPQIAVAIVIQNVDQLGGEVAAPMAQEIINYSLSQLNK